MDGTIRELVDDFRNGYLTRRGFLAKATGLGVSALLAASLARQVEAEAKEDPGTPADVIWDAITHGGWEVVDLSVTCAVNHPTNWPTDPLFRVIPYVYFSPVANPYGTPLANRAGVAVQGYELTEHTATQIDFPPHFVPPPGVTVDGVPGNAFGLKTGDQFRLEETMGPAVIVDCRGLLAANRENGKSAHLTRAWLERWEAIHGRLQPGEVPCWYSEYSDQYYKPFPNNDRSQDRMLWAPLMAKSAPGWVAADPDAMELLNERGVRHAVTDGPSWGWTENGQPSHYAGLKYGRSWTETATNLGSLPVRGAFYAFAPYKVQGQQAGIGRAFALKVRGAAGVRHSPPLML
jgi:kynurenine formamidase